MGIVNQGLVALIDSNSSHSDKVAKALSMSYHLDLYDDSKEAFEGMYKQVPAIILISPETKPIASIDVIHNLRAHKKLSHIPIVCIIDSEIDPNYEKAKELRVDSIITKPYSRTVLAQTIGEILSTATEKEWAKLDEKPREALTNTSDVFKDISNVLITGETIAFDDVKQNCQSLVDVVESNNFGDILNGVRSHDDYTYVHSMRVATLLTLLGHEAGFRNNEQLIMSSGGLLHDIGKMMIPHNILNKPGKLTDEEFEIMKSHVPETMDYLKKSGDIPKGVMIIAEQHHEKLDGTGYPNGLKGKELNELARMAAIVDVFSALTDKRVYKEPMPASQAMDIITDEMAGNHLDPHYVKMFRSVLIDAGILY